jgi:Protein of unknown function (DUF2845)
MNWSSCTIFVCALHLACSPRSVADTPLRCGNKLVDVGMTMDEILQHCGEPAEREIEQHDVRSGGRVVGKTQLSRWTYRQWGGTRVLEFDREKLILIR